MNPTDLAAALVQPGRASIPYIDPFSADRPLILECFHPERHDPDKPVVIVQHGMSRNGAEYCQAWAPVAEMHGFLVVAVTFPQESWPDAVTYNNGHVLTENGTLRPRDAWSHAIPGRFFVLLREAGVTARDKMYLWGHSAGGQFVHRLLATQPHAVLQAVGAANSGWYTLPTLDKAYPDGLGGIGLTQDDVARLLGYPLVIFSGDLDIDGTAENFPRHPAAMAPRRQSLRTRAVLSGVRSGRSRPAWRALPLEARRRTRRCARGDEDVGFRRGLLVRPHGRLVPAAQEATGISQKSARHSVLAVRHSGFGDRRRGPPCCFWIDRTGPLHVGHRLDADDRHAHDTMIECLPSYRSADKPAKYPPIRFGDYALRFARKSYEHMAHEPALPDAVVAPGARATARW